MTIDQMRAVLGFDETVSDDAVVQAYVIYLEGLPQAVEPLSIAEAKSQLGIQISNTNDDPMIGGLIIAAREWAESYTGLILTAREVTETRDGFCRWVDIYSWPIRSITSVGYLDDTGATQVLDATGYVGTLSRRPVRLSASSGAPWPVTSNAGGAVTITVQAGYATSDEVPQSIKQAMLLMIRHWFDNPSAVAVGGSGVTAVEVPLSAAVLLDQHRLRIV